MVIATETGHHQRRRTGRQRAGKGNELQHRRQPRQQHGVGDAHEGEGDTVGHEGGNGQQEQRPYVAREQHVQILDDAIPQLAVGTIHPGQNFITHGRCLLDQQEADDRHQHQVDQVAGRVHHAHAELLGQGHGLVGAIGELVANETEDARAQRFGKSRQRDVRDGIAGAQQRRQLF
ncbi:hypothetical protein GWL_23920 [Herbaspirillum sp. GW103]|nr:hypothetical protein GWL_23920 [Herbaspirillum sp. GW103]